MVLYIIPHKLPSQIFADGTHIAGTDPVAFGYKADSGQGKSGLVNGYRFAETRPFCY